MPSRSLLLALLLAAPATAQGPTLVPATLRNVSPGGVARGQTVILTLDGTNLREAERAVFDDPNITGTCGPGANANQVKVTARIGEQVRPGIHRVHLETPLGTTGSVTFAVGAWPEKAEQEPNEAAASGPIHPLPATFTGALGRAGDVDCFRFQAEAGQELAFEVLAGQIRSQLNAVLTLLDARGKVLAESQAADGQVDPVLAFRFREAGEYAIRLRDFENAGGANVTYRLNAGAFPLATHVFPLGVRKGGGEVTLAGFNLGPEPRVKVKAERGGWGETVSVATTPAGPLLRPVTLAAGEEPEILEAETSNNTPATAQTVAAPVTVNGRIAGDAGTDVDHYRFRARKGAKLVLEVQARRLGSPLDPVIEVLDAGGNKVERATLRCVAETVTTLSDRDSATSGLRMLSWRDFNVRDLVYVRGEVLQLVALPRGPDDDARFRSFRGQRLGLFDTTPSGHAVNTPMYKVQVHPPGTTFPPNGMPVFRLYYRNDDGGPLYGKDSHLSFTAPADGEYVVRVADVRASQGERHAYRLTIRAEQPDFRLSLNPAQPNIPAGSRVPVEVSADRLDGFTGEIRVRLENLPPGITATAARIEAGETSATLLLTAAPEAKTAEAGRVRLIGEAEIAGLPVVRTEAPAGGRCRIAILPRPDLQVTTPTKKIIIVPGSEQHVDAAIVRRNKFAGRVPVDLKNLPFGVRILDVGLNGVLIPEGETSRRFTLVCEPWVKPMQRPVYCTVRTETGSAAPTEVAAEPILLEVRLPETAP